MPESRTTRSIGLAVLLFWITICAPLVSSFVSPGSIPANKIRVLLKRDASFARIPGRARVPARRNPVHSMSMSNKMGWDLGPNLAVGGSLDRVLASVILADSGDVFDPTKIGLAVAVASVVAAVGFKTAVYWRMQYVVAALLSNRVPTVAAGAEILELSARDTKTLYYMPTGGVRRVTLSTIKDLEQEIVNGAAMQAKVPTALARKQEGDKINCASGTMDCVVSAYGFSNAVEAGGGKITTSALAHEVARVLRPGGTLLFVEKGDSPELVEEIRTALGNVEVNIVQNFVEPYCVALGTKTKEDKPDGYKGAAAGFTPESGKKRHGRRRGSKKAGA